MTKRTKKILLFSSLIVIAIFGAFSILFILATPYSAIKPMKLGHKANYEQYGITPEKFDVKINDTLSLRAVLIRTKSDSAYGTIILLHGIAACKEQMLSRARDFAKEGFNSILLDMRAHGESGGMYCTFGYYEKYDIKKVIDYALEHFTNIEPIAISGHSLGGAVSVQSMAIDPRIKAGCVSGAYSRTDEVVREYMARLFIVIRSKSISDYILNKSAKIAEFNPFEVNPEDLAKKVYQPIFIYHGELDNKIIPQHGLRIYNNIASKVKRFEIIKNADHDNIYEVGGRNLFQEEVEFLKQNLPRK